MSEYQSPLLSRPGAAEAQGIDATVDSAGVAWHYGNPLREQARLSHGPIMIDRSHRAVIKVTGKDAPEFLNNLLSQLLLNVPFAGSALNLDAQGRIVEQADVLATSAGEFYLDLPAGDAQALLAYLGKMIFWSEVSVERVPLAVLTVLGQLPADLKIPESWLRRRGQWQLPRTDFLIDDLLSATSYLEAQGVALAGLMAFSAERVKALEPERPTDLDEKSIPHEVPSLIGRGAHVGAVHLDKGCYRGQETVARVENLGRSPRVLVMVQLDGSAPQLPTPSATITSGSPEGRAVGRLGTVVHDCDFGPIGLAIMKRSALPTAADAMAAHSHPLLFAGEVALAVDPSSLEEQPRPQAGREAIKRLRGK